jgi:hypothetical protein
VQRCGTATAKHAAKQAFLSAVFLFATLHLRAAHAPRSNKGESMATIRMEFWRNPYDGPACIEYSWVPEGARRNILLQPGQQEGYSDDTVADDLKPSHVQVYVANNEPPPSSLEMWQFPQGAPYPAPIVRARVELHSDRMEARGTVWYADGAKATDQRALEPRPRKCPTGL